MELNERYFKNLSRIVFRFRQDKTLHVTIDIKGPGPYWKVYVGLAGKPATVDPVTKKPWHMSQVWNFLCTYSGAIGDVVDAEVELNAKVSKFGHANFYTTDKNTQPDADSEEVIRVGKIANQLWCGAPFDDWFDFADWKCASGAGFCVIWGNLRLGWKNLPLYSLLPHRGLAVGSTAVVSKTSAAAAAKNRKQAATYRRRRNTSVVNGFRRRILPTNKRMSKNSRK